MIRLKRAVKIIVDMAMTCLFFYLMGYSVVRGLMNHALGGIALFVLFLAHHLLNLAWYRALFKGRYPGRRILLTSSDSLLMLAMLLMAVSSVMMSSSVFSFSRVPMTQFGHDLHVCSTAWGYILMCFHLGLHTHAPLEKMRKKLKSTAFEYVWYLLLLLVCGGGIYAFVRSGLWSDLFLLHAVKMPFADELSFYTAYVGILASLCIIVHGLLIVVKKKVKVIQEDK